MEVSNLSRSFSLFYNGQQTKLSEFIQYHEILTELIEKILPKQSLLETVINVKGDPNFQIRSNRLSEFENKIDRAVISRLSKIKQIVEEPEKLCAAVILCDKNRRSAIISKAYGTSFGSAPVIERGRVVASTIKIALYSSFFESCLKPASFEYEDRPFKIKHNGKVISPRNSDNKFRGNVSLEYAFANSINSVAMQIIDELGVESFVKYLRLCGVHCPLPNTPLLALGAFQLTGWELLATLSPLLYGGHLVYIPNPRDQNLVPGNNGKKILSPHTSQKMNQLLKSTVTCGTAKYIRDTSGLVGGKTGTSENNTDLWFVGTINSRIYGLVWLGREDAEAIQPSDGLPPSAARFAVPLWSDLLSVESKELV